MHDYFAALAARTLQPEQGVQPRPRVRWEEVPPQPLDAIADVSGRAVSAAGEASEPVERRRPVHADRQLAAEATVAANNRSQQPAPEQSMPVRGLERPQKSGSETPAAPISVRTPAPPVHVRSLTTDEKSRVSEGHREITRRRSLVASDGHGTIRAPRALPPGASRERASSDTAIRIHIGRVDVRAVPSPEAHGPARSKEVKRALMSLDEYVQKRDRGAS